MGHNRSQPEAWPVQEVADVLQQREELSEDDALSTAKRLRDLFDGDTVVEDTEIESEDRAFLWSLLLDGIVTVETQHRPHPDHGRTWRYFYWHLVPPERLSKREETEDEEPTVYDDLPPEIWRRHAAAV